MWLRVKGGAHDIRAGRRKRVDGTDKEDLRGCESQIKVQRLGGVWLSIEGKIIAMEHDEESLKKQ